LTEVELNEGLVEIGRSSFAGNDHSITKINIPSTLRRICNQAFYRSLRTPIRLHDGIESIGFSAFAACIFTNFRVPPLITVIPDGILDECSSMISLEMPENVTEIGNGALTNCYFLRNVAIPPNAVFGDNVFIDEGDSDDDEDEIMAAITDLIKLFGNSNARIISELQHRFDGRPIHRLVYYQSYNQGMLQDLVAAIDLRSGQRRTLRPKLDPTGNQQDCLGMTPLHILTCSSVHDMEVYRLIIENYPANLITEDRWGAPPLLYAFWRDAPSEIIYFLLESYQSLYPGYVFNWTMMVETMCMSDSPKEIIENLIRAKQLHFPEQPLDWDYLLGQLAEFSEFYYSDKLSERLQFLVSCGMSTRVEALAFKVWRDHITNMIQTSNFACSARDNSYVLNRIEGEIAHFEDELQKLKEVTTILELALWKMKMNEKKSKDVPTPSQKKVKTDESITRQQCRVTCGADVIIGPVLQFLIATGDEIYDYDTVCLIEEDLDGEEYLDGVEVRDSDINLD
jgi:hypothetical protein